MCARTAKIQISAPQVATQMSATHTLEAVTPAPIPHLATAMLATKQTNRTFATRREPKTFATAALKHQTSAIQRVNHLIPTAPTLSQSTR